MLRNGQSKFLRYIDKDKQVAIHALTGFGKTVLVLSGIGYRFISGDRQLYIFTKTKTQLRSVFLRNLKKIYNRPPLNQLTVVPLIAKRDLCSHRSSYCHRFCDAKKQAFRFPNANLRELLFDLTVANCPETLTGYRKFFQSFGCPYHLINRLLPQANIVLLTQGYLEHLFLREKLDRFLSKAEQFRFNSSHREVIIDEAHNFGPTVEVQVTREQLHLAFDIAPCSVTRALNRLLEQPLGSVQRPKEAMFDSVKQLDIFLGQKRSRLHFPTEEREVLRVVRSFIQRNGQHWVLNEKGLIQLNPYPSSIFKFLLPRFNRIILLSGTFYNRSWYRKYYGLPPGFKFYQMPFSNERRQQLFFATLYRRGISSRLKDRSPELNMWYAQFIHEMALLAGDHTLVYVPSYEVLDGLFPLLTERFAGHLPLFREPSQGRIQFMSDLINGSPSVVLAVYGGKLSEGIEIRHPSTGRSRIRLMILIGMPFPVFTPEYRLLKKLYQNRWKIIPFAQWAILERRLTNIIHQCMGRGIRSEQDKGAAVLLDDRSVKYLQLRLLGMRIFTSRQALANALTLALVRARK
ncbi:MAG: helicase C-terminal domain-containing protein [Candidatus Hodarchaeales archaeon]|jgi:Rad3-related DNA helicase